MADNDLSKMLYVRLPHTIKSPKEIQDLCVGNVKVKLTRQSSRHCHVVFSSVEEKMKNLKNIKKTKINGKNIIAFPPKINPTRPKKNKEKKIKTYRPKPESKISAILHISNIKPGTKAHEIKDAFPGCSSVLMVTSKRSGKRVAYINVGGVTLADEYLRKERQWPEVRGNVLTVAPDMRKRKRKSNRNRKSSGLKIYDGEDEDNGETMSKKGEELGKTQKKESTSSQESEENEEEEETDSDESDKIEEE